MGVGNERDLQLTATSGGSNQVLTAGGNSLLQYDGADNSLALNPSGLFNDARNNFRAQNAFALHTQIETDINTQVTFKVYSGSAANRCEKTVNVPANAPLTDYFLNYADFTNVGTGCDFSNVGALEIQAQMFANVDVIIQFVSLYGPVPVSPSATPSRTRTPTPSRTPTPTPSPQCVCHCPRFHCELIRYDDGDFFFADPLADVTNFFMNLI